MLRFVKMKKIAYIITNSQRLKNNREYIGVVDSISKAAPNTPILIIGLESARKTIKDFSILNRNPHKDVFWTFGKREKRNEYENDLKNFYDYAMNNEISKVEYHYINPLTLNHKKLLKLVRLIYEKRFDKYFYSTNGMIYCNFDKKVIGFSLKMMKYAYNISEERIFSLIKQNTNNRLYNESSKFIESIRKYVPKNKTYALSYLMSFEDELDY